MALDAIGNSSYALPGLGEAADLAWGPLQALIVGALFSGQIGQYGQYLSAVEEMLPFTDVIPSSTLLWLRVYSKDLVSAASSLHNNGQRSLQTDR